MKILVTGGTGTVGSNVARELLARGAQVHVLTRSAEKAKQLQAGTRAVLGDLLDPATVRSVFRGMDGVFLLDADDIALLQVSPGPNRLVHGRAEPYSPHTDPGQGFFVVLRGCPPVMTRRHIAVPAGTHNAVHCSPPA